MTGAPPDGQAHGPSGPRDAGSQLRAALRRVGAAAPPADSDQPTSATNPSAAAYSPAASSPAAPPSIAASLALQLLPLLPFSHTARLALCRLLAGPYPGALLPLPTCLLLPLPQPPPLPPTIKS